MLLVWLWCLFDMVDLRGKYILLVLALLLGAVLLLIIACQRNEGDEADEAYKESFSSKLYTIRNDEDSLNLLLNECLERDDDVGAIIIYRQLGKHQRDNARFSDAIATHQEGLNLALKVRDTLEIVQALNNLGTDFRRIGVLAEASSYHYQALSYSEAYSKVNEPGTGMKNRVVSLNGLGNISLTLGYLDEAEKYFRGALKDEVTLSSTLGQAINYANIGAIYELRQQYDSARVYYEHSMKQNVLAKSDMGIGLCHIHFGDLHAIEGRYDLAKEEYAKALTLMQHIADSWHWLEAGLAIAEVSLQTNDLVEFKKYIRETEQVAREIQSLEHLAKVHGLWHDYYSLQGDHANAMSHYKRSIAMRDSIQGVQRSNVYLDMRVNYERDRNERLVARIEAEAAARESRRAYISYVLIAIILIGGGVMAVLYYAYKERSRSNKLLKEMERTRSDFFTNITHEIRTPLTVIQGFNKRLQENESITEKEREAYRKAIDRQSSNLLNMVNQLLSVAKVSSGNDKPGWRHGDIVPYLRMVAETFRLHAKVNHLELIFYTDLTSLYMDFVPFYVDRIVSNLLTNAIKHSNPGDKIHLIFTQRKGGNEVILRVTDTGEGIPPEDLGRIFEMFYQSRQSENVDGSWIGLAFVRLMVERMDGTVVAESQLGKGSSFTVTLPIKNARLPFIVPLEPARPGEVVQTNQRSKPDRLDVTSVATRSSADRESDKVAADFTSEGVTAKRAMDSPIDEREPVTEKSTGIDEEWEGEEGVDGSTADRPLILVVEDNKDVAMYVKSLLNESYRVLTASNGQEGFEVAEANVPDLIVTDVMMPVKDGYQLCQELQGSRLLNHVPIIMLTAKVGDEDKMKGLSYGIHSYLKKPFYPEELTLLIANILDSRKRLKEKYLNVIINRAKDEKLKSDENTLFLQTVTDLIHSSIADPNLSIFSLADEMSMSTSQLNRKMKGITGYSTISYVLKVKLHKARKMLTETDRKIADVSEACGFQDSSYFSRVFKKEFGFTPSQIQRRPENGN